MKKPISHLAISSMAFALVALAADAAQAQVVAKKCVPPPDGVTFKAFNLLRSTTSTTFVDISNAAVNFTQGGSKPGCVIVYFSGLGGAINGFTEAIQIRATIDGVAGWPSQTVWSMDDDENNISGGIRSRGISFVFPSVAPGDHTLRMQWRSFDGVIVQLNDHNTIVYYVR